MPFIHFLEINSSPGQRILALRLRALEVGLELPAQRGFSLPADAEKIQNAILVPPLRMVALIGE